MHTVLQKRRSRAPAKSRKAPLEPGPCWAIRRAARIQLLTANSLEALPWLVHDFSTRPGGDSLLDGTQVLNLGFTEWDSRACVTQNRERLQQALGAAGTRMIALRQIHSDVVRVFAAPPGELSGQPATSGAAKRAVKHDSAKLDTANPDAGLAHAPRGDASITREAGLLLGIQTADCVPILLVDTKRRVVAAIHAGWRGTLARIAEKVLGRMRFEFGTQPPDVLAAIGPAIGRCCYTVGPEVVQAFAGQFDQAEAWVDGPLAEEPNPLQWMNMMPPGHQPPPAPVHLDLPAANRWQLEHAGILPRNITVSPLCTACHTDLLFSYRREGPGTGRMMAAIGIRSSAQVGLTR